MHAFKQRFFVLEHLTVNNAVYMLQFMTYGQTMRSIKTSCGCHSMKYMWKNMAWSVLVQ